MASTSESSPKVSKKMVYPNQANLNAQIRAASVILECGTMVEYVDMQRNHSYALHRAVQQAIFDSGSHDFEFSPHRDTIRSILDEINELLVNPKKNLLNRVPVDAATRAELLRYQEQFNTCLEQHGFPFESTGNLIFNFLKMYAEACGEEDVPLFSSVTSANCDIIGFEDVVFVPVLLFPTCYPFLPEDLASVTGIWPIGFSFEPIAYDTTPVHSYSLSAFMKHDCDHMKVTVLPSMFERMFLMMGLSQNKPKKAKLVGARFVYVG